LELLCIPYISCSCFGLKLHILGLVINFWATKRYCSTFVESTSRSGASTSCHSYPTASLSSLFVAALDAVLTEYRFVRASLFATAHLCSTLGELHKPPTPCLTPPPPPPARALFFCVWPGLSFSCHGPASNTRKRRQRKWGWQTRGRNLQAARKDAAKPDAERRLVVWQTFAHQAPAGAVDHWWVHVARANMLVCVLR